MRRDPSIVLLDVNDAVHYSEPTSSLHSVPQFLGFLKKKPFNSSS
jgi:hypothetical protein